MEQNTGASALRLRRPHKQGIHLLTASKRQAKARVYEHPIPEREEILKVLKRGGAPMPLEALALALSLEQERDQEALRRRLGAMRRDGQVADAGAEIEMGVGVVDLGFARAWTA